MLMFIYYTTDITAKMTSGPPGIPIRSFDDVIEHGYRVIVTSGYYKKLLANSQPGTSKQMVYKMHIEKADVKPWDESIREVIEHKTLIYYNDILPRNKPMIDQLVILKMDAPAYSVAGFALQKDSEFRGLFNHYILKGKENGILDKLFRQYHMNMFTKEQFWMPEPQELHYSNVVFLFICLVAGVSASVVIATVEFIISVAQKKCL